MQIWNQMGYPPAAKSCSLIDTEVCRGSWLLEKYKPLHGR